jgi:capsular polysaccharide transport system ATP-binding protein
MSIRFRNLRKFATHAGANQPLLDGVDFFTDRGMHVGILGGAKAGKSTMLRLICGTDFADSGAIERSGRISWPIPLSTFLTTSSTVAMNIRFMARLYGVKDEAFPRRTAEMLDFAEFLNVPLKNCPKFVKPRLALAIPIGIGFDIYLFDQSFAPVDKEFREMAKELIVERISGSGYVLATSNPGEVEQNCNSVYVLDSGRARYFEAAKDGVEHFKKQLKAERQKEGASEGVDGVSDNDDADDVGEIDVLGTAVTSVIE